MTRKLPDFPVPAVKSHEIPGVIKQTRWYKVITPLYGGGEEPAKADSVTIVRATEVRGHLRFWWRATRGGAFDGDVQKMKRHEEEIWGSPGEKGRSGPSKVSITVIPLKRGNAFQAKDRHGNNISNIGHPNSLEGYVAFPLREERNPVVLENVEFELKIEYPKEINKVNIEKDVEAAFWAWETFGGIGARTRRGFGALQLTYLDGNPIPPISNRNVNQTIVSGLQKYVVNALAWPKGVPHLFSNVRYKAMQSSDPISAWRSLVQKLRDFRQSRYPDQNNRAYGRSKWPEPDAIRRRTTSAAKHKSPRSTLDRFPRGKFGLPIIFQFKEGDVALGDPDPTTLQGEGDYDRLASPLILRPIACSDGAVGLAAILEWQPMDPEDESYTPPGGLVLKGALGDPHVESNLTAAEAKNISPLSGQPDVLQAFLDFLK